MWSWSQWRKAGAWAAGGAAALLLSVGGARADDREMIQELRARVEALEKQNQVLMKSLQQGQLPPASVRTSVAGEAKAEEQDQIQKIVTEYLKDEEARKKKDEDLKKKEADALGYEVGKDLTLRPRWNHRLEFESADKAFKLGIGGRTQFDGAWISTSDAVQFGPGGIGLVEDSVNFRRARLEMEGTLYEVFSFSCEYDFLNTFIVDAGGDKTRTTNVPVPIDLWGQISQLPLIGNFRFGNQRSPISFEHMMSSRFHNFMERSLGFDAFIEDQNNGRRPGLQVFNWADNERGTWAAGVFKNTRNITGWNMGDGEYEVTGRVTCLPWYANDGRCLVHLGLGASYRDLDDHQARFRSRILIRDGPAALHNIVSEARMFGDSQALIVPEFVVNYGPFTLQTEYTATWVHNAVTPLNPPAARRDVGTAFYQAYYIEGLYFLTGEHRGYNTQTGVFGRVIPRENFYFVRADNGRWIWNHGAWQVAARYSYLDLVNKGITGGVAGPATIHDVTFGLNWFLNPNLKIQWNYSYAYRDSFNPASSGDISSGGMRFALDF